MAREPQVWSGAHAELLQRADPAAAGEDPPAQIAARRAQVVAAVRPASAPSLLVPATAAVALATLLVLTLGRAPAPPPGAAVAAADERLEVHFATAGGTRIVWVLTAADPF